ncbi:MAG: AraC family transcriptional regulator ligand-binding domain-containing protein [Pseudomonadota bacterium]
MLRAAGLSRRALRADDATVTMGQFETMLDAAAAQFERSDIGFELGRLVTFDSHGPLTAVLARCTSVNELLAAFARYYKLITPCFSVRYHPGARRCEYVTNIMVPIGHGALHAVLDMHAVSICTQLNEALGAVTGAEIHLSCAPPPHAARYRELGPITARFGRAALPQVRLVFPAALGLRVPAHRFAVNKVGNAAAQLELAAGSYAAWVEMMLREAEGLQPTLEILSELLAMSPRSLTRKLAAQGADLRKLSLRVRHERACRLLATTTQAQAQIAARLGYNDESSFVRAFRAAAGITPGRWRQRHGPCLTGPGPEEMSP